MSRPNSALASLTATYTDTDSEPEDDDNNDSLQQVSSVENMEESPQTIPDVQNEGEKKRRPSKDPEPSDIQSKKPRRTDLVSYEDGEKDDRIDDEAIDDYDFYKHDSRHASDAEESNDYKSSKESPGAKPTDSEKDDDPPEDQVKTRKGVLPPIPTAPVSAEAQRLVNKMLESKLKRHLDVNKYIQSNKSFRNPSIYEKLIEYCNIDELGTNYPKETFDPHGWPESSYYDELAKAQKAEMDRREKARRERVKVEIVSGVVPKKTIPLMAPSAATAAVAAAVAAAQAKAGSTLPAKEGEKRKSKWDQRV